MQRTSAAGPTHLFTHDFAGQAAPVLQARDNEHDWSARRPITRRASPSVDGNSAPPQPQEHHDRPDQRLRRCTACTTDSITAYGLRWSLAGANDPRRSRPGRDLDQHRSAVATLLPTPIRSPSRSPPSGRLRFADDRGVGLVYVLPTGASWPRSLARLRSTPSTPTVTGGTTGQMPLLGPPTTPAGHGDRLRRRLPDCHPRPRRRGAQRPVRVRPRQPRSLVREQRPDRIHHRPRHIEQRTSQDLYAWDLPTGSAAQQLARDGDLGAGYRGAPKVWKP